MTKLIEHIPTTDHARAQADCMQALWSRANVGDKVKCVKQAKNTDNLRLTAGAPTIGEVYTIRELRRGTYKTWALGYTFEELMNEANDGLEPFFAADCFSFV